MPASETPPTQPDGQAARPISDRSALSKFDVITELGRGGMADVFLAMTRGPAGFNKLIVLKRIREDIARDARFLDMLLDEARLAALLNHPNIVQTNEVGVDDEGRFFVGMEYLEGQSLAKLLERLRSQHSELPMRIALRIVRDALAGLHHAHELVDLTGKRLDVVHCDVSPHNLFVTYAGQVKLLDFGLARATSSAAEAMSGEVRGKLYYMAPEQAAAKPVDRRADVFAMGGVLWELLTGYPLWRGQTDIAVACSLRFGEIPALSPLAPELPKPLVRVCQKALAFKPDERFASAHEFRLALEQIEASLPAEPAAEDLGLMVARLFEEERRGVRKLIGAHMDRIGSRQVVGALGAATQASPASRPTEPSSVPAPRLTKRWRKGLLVAGVGGAAIVAALLVTREKPAGGNPPVAGSTPHTTIENPLPPTRVEIRGRAEPARQDAILDLTLKPAAESIAMPTANEPAAPKPSSPPAASKRARAKRAPVPATRPTFEDPWGGT